MSWHVLDGYDTYSNARASFEWDLPESYNPAHDLLRKHDDADKVALVYEPAQDESTNENQHAGGAPSVGTRSYTFRDLDERSDRLAAGLETLGVAAGDRVGVALPQIPATPLTHLACWKLGAITVPLTVLFGRDALEYRLADSDASVVVADSSVREAIDAIRGDCPALEHVIERGGSAPDNTTDFDALVARNDPGIDIYESTPETPSAIMYTSGSTGPPKGVLHSHALWLGRAAAAYNYFNQGLHSATVWTPADWAWGAALGGTLCAAWHYGARVVGHPRREFDPEATFELLERHDITHSFMPPTALRMLMSVEDPTGRFDLSLETLAAAGEPLTPELLDWVADTFDDVALNEFYGQTELNLCVGNCSRWFEVRPESMGKPLPGYDVAVLDTESRERVPTGETGELAVRPHDRRVFFDEYWDLPEKTAAKQLERIPGEDPSNDPESPNWFLTGDLVERDADGYLWFVSRADDVILTRGYRVGPMEVESTILEHPAVEQVGVVGQPDETIGEAIAAFVEPVGDIEDPDAVREEIRELVRERLAQYEYPQCIEFVAELPTTSTGKIRRRSLRD